MAALPADLPAAVFIVVHFPPDSISMLPSILNRYGPLPATTAQNNEPIQPGHIYVAPPDYHLLVRDGTMQVYRGPRENHTRPAIDPLFRSAAQTYGIRVVGVLLSGMLNDGTAGLIEIKRQGGLAVVQDPDDAVFPDMPRSAVKNVSVDYVLPLVRIASMLTALVSSEVAAGDAIAASAQEANNQEPNSHKNDPIDSEADTEGVVTQLRLQNNPIAADTVAADTNKGSIPMSDDSLRNPLPPSPLGEEKPLSYAEYTPTQEYASTVVAHTNRLQIQGERDEQPSVYSCPDCGGVLWQMNEQGFLRFRCHVGHAHSAESLLKQQVETLESSMWYAVHTLSDRANLSHQLAKKARERGHNTSAGGFDAQALAAEQHAAVIRKMIENGLADMQAKALDGAAQEHAAR